MQAEFFVIHINWAWLLPIAAALAIVLLLSNCACACKKGDQPKCAPPKCEFEERTMRVNATSYPVNITLGAGRPCYCCMN